MQLTTTDRYAVVPPPPPPQWERTVGGKQPTSAENVDFVVERKKVAGRLKGNAAGGRASNRPAVDGIGQRKEEEIKTTLAPEAWLDRKRKMRIENKTK